MRHTYSCAAIILNFPLQSAVGRAGNSEMPEQIAAGGPILGPSAVAAKGGKFRTLAGEPGYSTVSH